MNRVDSSGASHSTTLTWDIFNDKMAKLALLMHVNVVLCIHMYCAMFSRMSVLAKSKFGMVGCGYRIIS